MKLAEFDAWVNHYKRVRRVNGMNEVGIWWDHLVGKVGSSGVTYWLEAEAEALEIMCRQPIDVCLVCGGHGNTVYESAGPRPQSDREHGPLQSVVPCSACNGTGRAPRAS